MSININLLDYLKNPRRIVLTYHLFFNDSPIGHLCSSRMFAVMNSGAGNTLTTIAALHPQ